MDVVQIKGIDKAKRQIQARLKQIAADVTEALYEGGLMIQRDSMDIVPVDTGNLRASCFCRVKNANKSNVNVLVGYTASYAIYVHENLDATHAPGKSAKFLERPARELWPTIRSMVRKAAKGTI